MNYVIGTIAVLFILYLLGNSEEEKEERPTPEPSVQEPIPDPPREIAFSVLAREYEKNPLKFMRQWENKTFIVKGTVRDFYTRSFTDAGHGHLKRHEGSCISISTLEYNAQANFVFSLYAYELDDVKVGDNVEIKGTLAGHMVSDEILTFTDCRIVAVNGKRPAVC